MVDNELKYVNGGTMKENKKSKLDQYFTKQEVSNRLYNKTIEIISQYDDVSEYTWIEPSAGDGSFYDLMPKNKRIGIDIDPKKDYFIKHDYLSYKLPKDKIIILGNPPFGHRGLLALDFINHSSQAEYVAFILPMFFQSKGKGSVRYRVNGFNLVYEEELSPDSFYFPNGKNAKVHCCFQIWSKNHKLDKVEFGWYDRKDKNEEPYSKILSVITCSLAKKRECGKEWIYDKKADFYLTSSFFGKTNIVYDFKDVKYQSGIAIVLNTNDVDLRNEISELFENADWVKYSSMATNGVRHIGKAHIYELLYEHFGEKYMEYTNENTLW